jgi:hypothetical protein
MVTREQMRGRPPATEAELAAADTIPDAPIVEPAEPSEPEEPVPSDDNELLPDGFVEQPDGSWIYKLRFPLRPTADDPDGTEAEKIRLPAHVYVDDLMKAAEKNPTTAFAEIVYTLAAVTGVGDAIFKRLAEHDFRALSGAYSLRRRRAAAHPT